jgi:hypothetical protein
MTIISNNKMALATGGVLVEITIPDKPVISGLTDNGDEDSITAAVVGTGTIQLYYRLENATWTAGQSRSGAGNIIQTGLTAGNWYEIYITDTIDSITSPPSAISTIRVISVEDSSSIPSNNFDKQIISEAQFFLDTSGETITYKPRGGNRRSIKAIVDREGSQALDGVPHGNSPISHITVANNSTIGISSSEIDYGGDKVTISHRAGQTSQDRPITKPISQDAGMMTLEVR